MKRRGFKRFLDNRSAAFKIQITSMVDMFIILLVFLLKSYSTSPVNITPNKMLRLPQSTSMTDPIETMKLIVSKEGIYVGSKKVVSLNNGVLAENAVDPHDHMFLRPLYNELDKRAAQVRNLASVNSTVNFDGHVLMQIDKDIPYSVIQKVLYSSMLAGYYNVKFAVVSK